MVSVLDSPAVDPRSNPGSGSALLMSEKSQAAGACPGGAQGAWAPPPLAIEKQKKKGHQSKY